MLAALENTTAIKALKLSELTGSIERMFKKFYEEKTLYVIADVTDHKHYISKDHRYLTLVEKRKVPAKLLPKFQQLLGSPDLRKLKSSNVILASSSKMGSM